MEGKERRREGNMFSPSITVVEKASMRTQSNEHDLKFSFAVRIPNSGNV
jgi:hypothetical protein